MSRSTPDRPELVSHETPADRFERYLAQTEREHPEVVDKIERLSGRRKREPLPLGRRPVVITVAVMVGILALALYATR